MPNTQTAVPVFTAGQVLTASQQTQINTGIPVFANTTTRDAAFGGAGEKTLAEGQFAYLEDSNTTQYYDGASWVAVGASALSIISPTSVANSGGTFTASGGRLTATTCASASVNGVFSATYQNYLILIDSLLSSSSPLNVNMRLRASGTDTTSATYYSAYLYSLFTTGSGGGGQNGTSVWQINNTNTTLQQNNSITLSSPFATQLTSFTAMGIATDSLFPTGGYQSGATSYDGFTILTPSGTFSAVITVYGYGKS